jgi:hypothetical protein
MATTLHAPGSTHAGPSTPPQGGPRSFMAKLRAPGFYRAAWMIVLAVAFAAALTWLVRTSTGHTTYHHFLSWEAILTVYWMPITLWSVLMRK